MNRKIRIGMVGGGKGAFIGSVHRIALRLDGYYELVAGSFSSDFENSKETGKILVLKMIGSIKPIKRWQKKSQLDLMELM